MRPHIFKSFFLILFSIILSGCFDTQFDFKTRVAEDGSVTRQTTIHGRGARLFKAPEGDGWKSQKSQSQGTSLLLIDENVKIEATGQFKSGQIIAPDYRFDIENQMKTWSEEDKTRILAIGIKEPMQDHIFGKNQIKINRIKGWFNETVIYQETFQNAGIMELLVADLKDELRKQNSERGESLQDSELEILAKLRLEEDILPEIRFKSQVELPGKIISTNGKKVGRRKAEWDFDLKSFEQNYSIFKMEAVSRDLNVSGIVILVLVLGIALLFIVMALLGILKKKSKRVI